MQFISGLLLGILIGFIVTCLCQISSECNDNKEDIEEENKNE